MLEFSEAVAAEGVGAALEDHGRVVEAIDCGAGDGSERVIKFEDSKTNC